MGKSEFVKWLENELRIRDWKLSDLARAAGVSPATITHILNEERNLGPDVGRAIARALMISEIEIFRHAGLLSPEPSDSHLETLFYLWPRLSKQRRQDLVLLARVFISDAETKFQMDIKPEPLQEVKIDLAKEIHNRWEDLDEQTKRELVEFLREVVSQRLERTKRLKTGGES